MARTYFGVPFTIFILSLYEIQYFTMMGLEISHISTADFVSSPWAIQDPVGCLAKHLADAMQEWNGPRRPSEWSMEDKDQAILPG